MLIIWVSVCLVLAVIGDVEGRVLWFFFSAVSFFFKIAVVSCWVIIWLVGDRLIVIFCFWWIRSCCCKVWVFSFCLVCCLVCFFCCFIFMGVGSGGVVLMVGGGVEGGVVRFVGDFSSLGWYRDLFCFFFFFSVFVI